MDLLSGYSSGVVGIARPDVVGIARPDVVRVEYRIRATPRQTATGNS